MEGGGGESCRVIPTGLLALARASGIFLTKMVMLLLIEDFTHQCIHPLRKWLWITGDRGGPALGGSSKRESDTASALRGLLALQNK